MRMGVHDQCENALEHCQAYWYGHAVAPLIIEFIEHLGDNLD